MTESSFPIVGQDLTNQAWAQAVGASGSGILDDWGSPYGITVNTNDTVTIRVSTRSGVARAVVNGFGHQIDANVSLSVPAVSSATRYHVGLLYDPANTALPVKLTVLKGTSVPLTAGQAWSPMYMFQRASGQTLAASTLYSPKMRLQPQVLMASKTDLDQVDPTMFLYGTRVEVTGIGQCFRASGSLSNPVWTRETDDTGWVNCTKVSGVTSNAQVRKINGVVYLKGYSYPTKNLQTQFTIPDGYRPDGPMDQFIFRGMTGNAGGTAISVRVLPNGQAQYYGPGGHDQINWSGTTPYPAA